MRVHDALDGVHPERLEMVEGTGHFIVDARPYIVAERALDFFQAA